MNKVNMGYIIVITDDYEEIKLMMNDAFDKSRSYRDQYTNYYYNFEKDSDSFRYSITLVNIDIPINLIKTTSTTRFSLVAMANLEFSNINSYLIDKDISRFHPKLLVTYQEEKGEACNPLISHIRPHTVIPYDNLESIDLKDIIHQISLVS